jgi:hypothetical protein
MMHPDFAGFVDELDAVDPHRARDLAAFFWHWEIFHDQTGPAGA